MKKAGLYLLNLFLSINLYCQNIDFSILANQNLVLRVVENDEFKTDFIKSINLKNTTTPNLTWYPVISMAFSHHSWILMDQTKILAIGIQGNRSKMGFDLQMFSLERKDSISQSREDTLEKKKLQKTFPEDWFYKFNDFVGYRIQLKTLFKILPFQDWWHVVNQSYYFKDWRNQIPYFYFFEKNQLTDFDFSYRTLTDEYYFYQRTARNFLLWRYTGGIKKDTAFTDWHLEHFYASDSTCAIPSLKEMPGWMGKLLLPDTTHFLPCTITDTAFFRGHNKAIQQGDQHWLINTSHGAIYYLADYGVVKVAQIENFQNYPAALLQRRLFIEDRDKGELIFFSRLIRTDREAPLPKYRSLITPRAISQRFGALATVPKTNRK